MKTLFTLLLMLSLIVVSGCKIDEQNSNATTADDVQVVEEYILGSDGEKYYLISEAVEPTEENGWRGKIASYRKEGDDTKHIMVSKGPPPTFRDIDIPLD